MKNYDVGIILTGITKGDLLPRDRVYLQRGADRLFHPLMLYRMGKIKRFLITGGSGLLNNLQHDVEAENLKKILLYAMVPDSVIYLEKTSRNTHENAIYSATILNKIFPRQKYLLITSSFHMRRAAACFKNSGIIVHTFSVDFYAEPRKWSPDAFIPNSEALVAWNILIKEWVGIMTYKFAGYI